MRRWLAWALLASLLSVSSWALADERPRIHVVASGHTLGKIAKRYSTTVGAICTANGIRRRDPIRPGQQLKIPWPRDKDGTAARDWRPASASTASSRSKGKAAGGLREIRAGGTRSWYYEPTGPGRLSLRPVIFYLHGRGGNAQRECWRWSKVARRLGWLVCPEAPHAYGKGRSWKNDWHVGRKIVTHTLAALRKKFGRRVQLYGNTLVGFSEGAHIAMNVGVREPRAFNRWLILAGTNRYWGTAGSKALDRGKRRVRRVYLITGKEDRVYEGTLEVRRWLRRAGVPVRVSTPQDMGHAVPLESKTAMYRAALTWLNQG